MSSDADVELLEAWRQGDAAAGDTLLRKYFTPLHRFFAANIRHRGDMDPEDLVQRTLEACVVGRDRVQSDVRSYLFGTARRILIGVWRKKRHGDDGITPSEADIVDVRTSPSSALARVDEQRLLIRALQLVPAEFKAVLERFYWEELPITAIAQDLGLPKGTVKSRLFRGKANLRDAMESLGVAERLQQRTLALLGDDAPGFSAV